MNSIASYVRCYWAAPRFLCKKSSHHHRLCHPIQIPARYQFGTIEVSTEQLQNWVGGATAAEAAQHVNPHAPLNAWVPLDASFKQYSYSAAMDLKTAVPLDANALLSAAQQGASVNESQGWLQNLNQAAIQSQLTDYQSRLKTYIDASATGVNSTVGDVIGKKIIPQQSTELLAGSLPYAVDLKRAWPLFVMRQSRLELEHHLAEGAARQMIEGGRKFRRRVFGGDHGL
jgi:hypothetical protein